MERFVLRCCFLPRSCAAALNVEHFDKGGKRHGGIDVPLRYVYAKSIGDQNCADHQQESKGQHHHRGISVNERSEEHTSELQSLMRISYAVFCLTKKKKKNNNRIKEH